MLFVLLFLVVHHHEQLVLSPFFFLINNSFLITYKKKDNETRKSHQTEVLSKSCQIQEVVNLESYFREDGMKTSMLEEASFI